MQRKIIPLLILVIYGCSGETVTTREIQNLSDKEVRILQYLDGSIRGDTIVLAPNGTKQISVKTKSNADENEDDCAENIDSAYTYVEGGGHIAKNIALSQNWEVDSDKTKNIPPEYEHKCVFKIRNSDLAE